jgi:hypothetical protein
MEPLASPPADEEPAPAHRLAHEPSADYDEPEMPRLPSGTGRALSEKDREKLGDVLRELLDCKRILERAREG